MIRLKNWISSLFLLPSLLCFAQDTTSLGRTADGGSNVASWQLLHPAGETVTFGGRPVDVALSPDGKTLYAKDNSSLLAVDVATWKIRQRLAFPNGNGGSLHGIVVRQDGLRVYATTAQGALVEATVAPNGTLAWTQTIALPNNPFPCGLALSANGQRAYVCLSRHNTLGVVDLMAGKLLSEIPVAIAPWDVVLTPDGASAFVSDWGGHLPKAGEKTAPSAGTQTPVDARGIASSGCVSFVGIAAGRETAQIETGLHPSDMALSTDGKTLYVANANSDTVSVINTLTRKITETIPTMPDPKLPFGSAPTGLALSADGNTLYVTDGGNNAVAVITPGKGGLKARIEGFIPTGWYPGAIVTDGQWLYIANVKGVGSRDIGSANGYNVYQYSGTINKILLPTRAQLNQYTFQVTSDSHIPAILHSRERASTGLKPIPVPGHVGEPSVFEHIIYIIKENRTYDQVFGDLKQGNGSPALCTYGRQITPNHHALAEQFALLDNFYCNGVNSADGHSWATEGNVTDHLEKAFGGFQRSYTFGDDPLTYSSSGFLWDNVLAGGLSFRNYGEMDYAGSNPAADFTTIYNDYFGGPRKIKLTHNVGIDNLSRYTNPDYPGWSTSIPDVLRADIFLHELNTFDTKGGLPNLCLIYLPNDHTGGDISAQSYLADNDLALGRIVDGLSHTKFWPKTCIFVVEDDPQNGFDHVDGHRSLCLVVSPYTKRGAIVHNFYNQTSVLHTMEQILGLLPMNQMDGAAPLMRDCFTLLPDVRPYIALPNNIPIPQHKQALNTLRQRSAFWKALTRKVRFDRPDASDDDALNRILWHQARGEKTPYPAKFAGPHGRGLKALGLTLEPGAAIHSKSDRDDHDE